MNKVTQSTINELSDTFEKIQVILLREKEDNWIRGISSIRNRLNQVDPSGANIEEVVKDVGISYRHMNSGQGSFADFMVWRDDFDERQKLNQEFESLADKAWKLLGL
jgi:hypothetical protein